jgi:hypothetical protein
MRLSHAGPGFSRFQVMYRNVTMRLPDNASITITRSSVLHSEIPQWSCSYFRLNFTVLYTIFVPNVIFKYFITPKIFKDLRRRN